MEMDYYTYNGFEETVAAFQRLGLIFSDQGFLGLTISFIAIGFLVGSIAWAVKGMAGSPGNPASLFFPLIVGVSLFLGLIVPTGRVHIYDPVRNAYQPVDGVPVGIVFLAGFLSKIERAVVDVIDTASVNPYADAAGAIDFSLVMAALNTDVDDVNFQRSLERYYEDCGTFALQTNQNGVTRQEMMRGTNDLRDTFAKFVHPALYTVYYPPGDDNGVTATCTEAWQGTGAVAPGLRDDLNDPTMFDGMKQRLCAKAGFNTGDPAQLNRCDAELISAMNLYGVAGASSLPYLRSVALARSISETMESADFSAATSRLINRQIMAEGMGSSQAMNEWVPKIRGYLLAVVLGMIPLAALFIMTPLVGKALMLVFGMFTWLTFWGITDAVASQMAYDMAFDAFQDIRTFGLGFEAFLHSPEASVKALGLFSKARTTSLILATVLSGALLGFGGFALTSFAQSLQSHFDQAGEAAGRQVALPEENTALQQRLLAVPGVQAALSRAGFDTAGLASGSSTMQSLGGAEAMITSALGGRPSPGRMNTAIGQANMGRQMGSAEGYAAGSGQGLGGVTEQAIRSESVNTQQSSVSSIARGSELSSMKGGINAAASFQGRQEAADLDSFRSVYSTLNGTDQISSDGLRNMASMFKASPLGLANALQEKGYSSADAARSFQLQSERLLSYADTLDRDPTAMDRIGQSQALRDITSSDAFRAAASTAGLASIRTGEQFAIESTAATGRAATATGSSWSTAQRVSNLSMGRQLGEADRMEAVSQFLGLDGSSVAGIATATETEGLSRVSIPITPNNYGSVVGGLMANGLIDDQGNALLSRHQGGVATLTLDPETNRPTSSTIEAGNKLFTYDLNQATSGSVIRDQHVDTREFDSSNRISGGYMAIMPQNLAPITDLIYSDTEMGARQDASLQLASQIAQHWTQLGLSETIESSTGTARQIGLGGNASSGLSGSGIARGLGISGSLSGSTSNFDNDSASFRVDNVKAHAIELLSNLETEIYNEFMDSRPPDAPPPSMNELNRALEEGVNQRLPIEFTNATQRMERLRDLELSDLREEAEPNGR